LRLKGGYVDKVDITRLKLESVGGLELNSMPSATFGDIWGNLPELKSLVIENIDDFT